MYYNKENKLEFDLVAFPDCLIVESSVADFTKCIGGSFHDVEDHSGVINSLHKVPLFKNLTTNKLEILASSLKLNTFLSQETIIKQGEQGSSFYIVKSGKIDIHVNNAYIRTLNENEYFGERSLFIKEARSATAYANGKVEVYVLEKDDFKDILEDNLKDYLMDRIFLQDNTIELKDLDYIQNLGSGNFGNVYLVRSKKNKYFYAIKAISKKQVDNEQLHSNLDMERGILVSIDHPFIMKLVKTLKDSKNIYFLTEYIKGKELFDVIRDIGLLNRYQTVFYGGSLMIAVDYLHKRKFIYRDIKPENVIVTEKVWIMYLYVGFP